MKGLKNIMDICLNPRKAKYIFRTKQDLEMNLEVEDDKKNEIGKVISSADSPVGIDAKKTHIIIINKLLEIEKRLDKLEKS